jgi:hypothetical protein
LLCAGVLRPGRLPGALCAVRRGLPGPLRPGLLCADVLREAVLQVAPLPQVLLLREVVLRSGGLRSVRRCLPGPVRPVRRGLPGPLRPGLLCADVLREAVLQVAPLPQVLLLREAVLRSGGLRSVRRCLPGPVRRGLPGPLRPGLLCADLLREALLPQVVPEGLLPQVLLLRKTVLRSRGLRPVRRGLPGPLRPGLL